MKTLLSEIPRAAQEKPLVILFCWERYNLFRMVLPRVVNATRRIGGFLWVVDDGSRDERIRWILDRYLAEGYLGRVSYGTKSRFIDWAPSVPRPRAWGGPCARRSVALHFLTRRHAPLVIFCDPDIILAPDALATMLTATRVAREAGIPASCYSGFRYSKTVFQCPKREAQGFTYRLHGPYVSMALSLVTLDTARRVASEAILPNPKNFYGKWSLNEYAVWAFQIGLQACYLMDIAAQHIGIGTMGRTFTHETEDPPFAFNEDGTPLQVAGFNLEAFLKVSKRTCVSIQQFAYHDHVGIEEPRTVHPEFFKLKEIIGGN